MVKGVAKRVIVVKSPDPKVFEEAIFIVREDYMKTTGVTRSQLLSEARRAAGSYTAYYCCGINYFLDKVATMHYNILNYYVKQDR